MLILITIFAFASAAHARDPIGEPGGHRPPSCNWSAINACVGQYHASSADFRARASTTGQKIAALAADMENINNLYSSEDAQKKSLDAERTFLDEEIAFIAQPEEAAAGPVLPGFPGLELLFSLTESARLWGDRYPADRAQKLTERNTRAHTESEELRRRMEENSRDIAALRSQIQEETASRDSLLSQAGQHDRMWQSGCHDQFCSGGD